MFDWTETRATPHKSIEIDQQAAKSYARYDKDILVTVPGTKKQEQESRDVRAPCNMNPNPS